MIKNEVMSLVPSDTHCQLKFKLKSSVYCFYFVADCATLGCEQICIDKTFIHYDVFNQTIQAMCCKTKSVKTQSPQYFCFNKYFEYCH